MLCEQITNLPAPFGNCIDKHPTPVSVCQKNYLTEKTVKKCGCHSVGMKPFRNSSCKLWTIEPLVVSILTLSFLTVERWFGSKMIVFGKEGEMRDTWNILDQCFFKWFILVFSWDKSLRHAGNFQLCQLHPKARLIFSKNIFDQFRMLPNLSTNWDVFKYFDPALCHFATVLSASLLQRRETEDSSIALFHAEECCTSQICPMHSYLRKLYRNCFFYPMKRGEKWLWVTFSGKLILKIQKDIYRFFALALFAAWSSFRRRSFTTQQKSSN